MLALHVNSADDLAFIDFAASLITGAAIENRVSDIWAVHIDNWFGERWLGFRGKVAGIVGFRNRSLTDQLLYPPFHPNRVMSQERFTASPHAQFTSAEIGNHELHKHQQSRQNFRRRIAVPGLYVWYSGNSFQTDQAAVMAYVVADNRFAAWYAGFQKHDRWQLTRTVGISRANCLSFIENGAAEDAK